MRRIFLFGPGKRRGSNVQYIKLKTTRLRSDDSRMNIKDETVDVYTTVLVVYSWPVLPTYNAVQAKHTTPVKSTHWR